MSVPELRKKAISESVGLEAVFSIPAYRARRAILLELHALRQRALRDQERGGLTSWRRSWRLQWASERQWLLVVIRIAP